MSFFEHSTERGIHTDNFLSSNFVTAVSHDTSQLQAEILKGDMDESQEDFVFNTKREVTATWTGLHEDDWNFHLNGFTFECGIFLKRKPVVLKFSRVQDASWQPFQLHLARCSKWGKGVDRAMRSGRTKEQVPAGPGESFYG